MNAMTIQLNLSEVEVMLVTDLLADMSQFPGPRLLVTDEQNRMDVAALLALKLATALQDSKTAATPPVRQVRGECHEAADGTKFWHVIGQVEGQPDVAIGVFSNYVDAHVAGAKWIRGDA